MSGITLDRVRALSASTDNIAISDGVDTLAVNADGSINVVISGQSNVYAEDSAHTTGDDGNFILAVRQDTKASTADANGDYAAMIQNSVGELYVTDEDVEALLTTIDADTSAMNTNLATVAGAVSGTEMQVDIVAPLPAGTNNIGDVDVLTMPGTQLEDAASAGGETLMMIGGYRQDADGSPVSADGDFHGFIFNANGQLKVEAQLDQTSNTSVVVSNASVDTTAGGTKLIASALTNRRELTIQNLGNQDIWVKNGSGVTAGSGGNGFLIPADSSAHYAWGDAIDPYAITASSSSNVKCIESV